MKLECKFDQALEYLCGGNSSAFSLFKAIGKNCCVTSSTSKKMLKFSYLGHLKSDLGDSKVNFGYFSARKMMVTSNLSLRKILSHV